MDRRCKTTESQDKQKVLQSVWDRSELYELRCLQLCDLKPGPYQSEQATAF